MDLIDADPEDLHVIWKITEVNTTPTMDVEEMPVGVWNSRY